MFDQSFAVEHSRVMVDGGSQQTWPGRLRAAFVSHAAGISPGSPVPPVARAAYALQALFVGVVLAEVAATDFTLGSGPLASGLYLLLWLALAAPLARRYGMRRAALFMESVSFAPLGGLLTVCATIMAASISADFADDWLIRSDQALGFDWLAAYKFSRSYPTVVHVLNFAYWSMDPQIVLVPLALALTRQERTMWVFFTAWLIALMATTLIFPLAPARGAAIHFGITPDSLSKDWFWQFGPRIDALRHGAGRDISSMAMGIVSVPSFHAAAAVMFTWAGRSLPYLSWPIAALNLLMVISTPISGIHYLVDVLAGVLVGAVAIAAARMMAARD